MAKIGILQPVVSVSWLYEHLKSENLIVLDGTINKVFDASLRQIPHARFFDIKNNFSNVDDPYPSAFPTTEQFQMSARLLGINNDSVIVVYDDKGIYSSARVWWLFKAFGYNNVAVLNGGFPEWLKQGFPTENMKRYHANPGNFDAHLKPKFMRFFNDMEVASKNKNHIIIDARSKARFNCTEPEPRVGLRMGTIPNSVNLPFEDLLTGNILKDVTEIASKFQQLAKKEDLIIFSCGSGLTACVLALGAELSGYKNIAVYDGSWTEWGSLVSE